MMGAFTCFYVTVLILNLRAEIAAAKLWNLRLAGAAGE